MNKCLGFIFVIILIQSCKKQDTSTTNISKETLFKTVSTTQSQIDFSNTLSPNDSLNILDYLYFYNGGGVAILDIDNDGLQDIYFTANQGSNKLYHNLGNLNFKDITDQSGTGGTSDWHNGIAIGDVNNDGFLDMYVSTVVGIGGLEGHNELYINNGNGTFTEQSNSYGIDLQNYGTTFFTDVSESMGIFGGINGYGLGLATADLNQDGWMDIYISNDFHGDDLIYLNEKGKRFRESAASLLGHTSRFSMGNDIADINLDGYPDILSLDMLSEDENVRKASDGDESIDTYKLRTERFGYRPQFARNMLQLNREGQFFTEAALLSGIEASDWSWSAIFADYNLDGQQDIFISNGIPNRPNDLDYIRYISNNDIQKQLNTGKLLATEALQKMPSGRIKNKIFSKGVNLKFTDQSVNWLPEETLISSGAAIGDLDNDGDLDIITNNTNATASLYENTVVGNYLKITAPLNKTLSIGTKAFAYKNGKIYYKEVTGSRGFQSSSQQLLHFGFENSTPLDSLYIVFPNLSNEKESLYTVKYDVPINQTIEIEETTAYLPFEYNIHQNKTQQYFSKVNLPKLTWIHKENNYIDFNRQKLIPYQVSDRGTALATGDIDNDGNDELLIGGSRGYHTKVMSITGNKNWDSLNHILEQWKWSEITDVQIADFNNDGYLDIFLVPGGGEVVQQQNSSPVLLYGPDWKQGQLPEITLNASTIITSDYDLDGDLDLFIGNHTVPGDFGKIPPSYLLENQKGSFTIAAVDFSSLGMVTDAVWTDYDQDGDDDLLIVGEWMTPTLFENTQGTLAQKEIISRHGLWQTIEPYDIDNDGDDDYILGNWGLNSKFAATIEKPLKMFYGDVDQNGVTETIIAQNTDNTDTYYTLLGLDELSSQLNYLKKKFPSFREFAGKSVQEVIGEERLKKTKIFEVNELASGILYNQDNNFIFIPFEDPLQIAPITAIAKEDFDQDGEQDLFIAGNYFGVTPYHGRYDGFDGTLINKKGIIFEGYKIGVNLAQKPVTRLLTVTTKNKKYLLVQINNSSLEVYNFGK